MTSEDFETMRCNLIYAYFYKISYDTYDKIISISPKILEIIDDNPIIQHLKLENPLITMHELIAHGCALYAYVYYTYYATALKLIL